MLVCKHTTWKMKIIDLMMVSAGRVPSLDSAYSLLKEALGYFAFSVYFFNSLNKTGRCLILTDATGHSCTAFQTTAWHEYCI